MGSRIEGVLLQLKEAIREPSVSFVQQTEKFEEVAWVQRHLTPVHEHEPRHMKEMGGLMALVGRRVLDFHSWDERMLVLGDNIGLMLSVSTGLWQSAQLSMRMRKISATLPGTGVRDHCRCVSSSIRAVPDAGLISGAIEKPPSPRKETATPRSQGGSDYTDASAETHQQRWV